MRQGGVVGDVMICSVWARCGSKRGVSVWAGKAGPSAGGSLVSGRMGGRGDLIRSVLDYKCAVVVKVEWWAELWRQSELVCYVGGVRAK